MNPQCRICRSGRDIDYGKSNPQNARDFGVSEASVRRHKKHMAKTKVSDLEQKLNASRVTSDKLLANSVTSDKIVANQITVDKITASNWQPRTEFDGQSGYIVSAPTPETEPHKDKLLRDWGYDPEQVEIVGPFKISRWERSPGNWLTSYRAEIHTKGDNGLAYEDIVAALEGYRFDPPKRHNTGKTFVLSVADLQVGKRDLSGGTPELLSRVMTSLHTAAERVKAERPDEIIIVDLGDLIEGFSNTGSQAQTNDIDLTTQIRTARRILTEAVKILAPLAPSIKFVTVPSNHCQVRATGSKDLASTVDNDFGLDINHQLEDIFSERNEYEHVKFVRPAPLSESVALSTVSGITLGFVHGHQARTADKVGEWWKGQSHGRRSNLHMVDILLHGHFHSLRISQSGDARWIFGAPTSDNGSAWFTNITGEQSMTGMLAFTVSDGMWSGIEIL